MQNIRMILEYDGTNYHGFEQTKTSRTISDKLYTAIQRLTDESVTLHAAVRTEPGVHARMQITSFVLQQPVNLSRLMSDLNRTLPQDIAVRSLTADELTFQASLGIESCTYQCVIDIAEIPDVFHRNYAYHTGPILDVISMKQAASFFVGTHDFSHFTIGKGKKNSIKTISELTLSTNPENTKLFLTLTANHFLRAMPQAICGTILQAGTGELTPSQIPEIFDGKRNVEFFFPSKALHLMNISYLA